MSVKKCYNIAELKKRARRHLPDPMYHYLAGGSDDEYSLSRNKAAYQEYEIIPYSLRDTSGIDLSCTVLGQKSPLPLILAPTGMNRLFHHDKEYAAARAADQAGLTYGLSTVATTSIEEISKTTSSPKMMQIYVHKDRGLTKALVERAKEAGFTSICLTTDTVVAGNRERDLVTGMGLPPKLTLKSALSFITHPYWIRHALVNKGFSLVNIIDHIDQKAFAGMSPAAYINAQFDRSLSWKDAEWLRDMWDGALVIKGLQNAADGRTAEKLGCDGLMISNHGGRQLDGAPAPIDCLQPIKDATKGDIQLIVDGGIRRGTDILKAIAMGADAVSIGRAYLYGLAAGGEDGVSQAIKILHQELERSMILAGCKNLSDLSPDMIIKR